MIKILKFFGKLVASILVLLFIISAFTTIILISFESQLFNPDFYIKVLDKEQVFERLPEIAAVQIRYAMGYNPCLEDTNNCEDEEPDLSSTNQGGPPSYFQALSQSDWELLLTGMLPPDFLEDQIKNVVGGLIEYIDSGEGDLALTISLQELKDHLSGEAGVTAISQLLDAQPECSKDDLLDMTRILEGKEEPEKDFLSCQPPDDFIENYTPQLEVLLRRSLRDVPDEINLAEGLFEDSRSGGKAATISAFGVQLPTYLLFKWIRWAIRMSPLFCVTLLLIIAFLAVDSFKGLNVWWGYPLAISGLIGFGLAMMVGPVAKWLTGTFLADRTMAGFSPVMIETGSGLAVQIIRSLFTQVRNYSLITVGMGLGIIISSSVLKGPGDQDTEEKKETEAEEPVSEDSKIENLESGESESGEDEIQEEESQEIATGEEPE